MIDPTARIDCRELIVGEGTIIRAHAEIYGGRVVLGRESFIDEYAVIGGGQAGDLTAGDWFHLGMFAQVNTARPVTIGDEVGIGIGSRIFTHGAYLNEYEGFPSTFAPVTIGSNVWIPNATVLPGVTIGSDVVIAAGSVVMSSIDDGQFVAGIPARVKGTSRKTLTDRERHEIVLRICEEADVAPAVCWTFDLQAKIIGGEVTDETERLREQFRRHGIRFRCSPHDGKYEAWT